MTRALQMTLVAVLLTLGPAETLLQIKLTYGDQRYQHESLRYTLGDETISFTRFACLLNTFSLEGESGTLYPLGDHVCYLEASPPRLEDILPTQERYPEPIVALRLAIGLTEPLNAANPNLYQAKHALNPSLNNLHWSQETGYIFLALEGMTRASGSSALSGYSLHYANQQNYLPMRLELPEPALALGGITLELDLEQVLAGIDFSLHGRSTHSKSNDPLAHKLKRNLASAVSILHLSGDLPGPRKRAKDKQRPPLYLPHKQSDLTGYRLKIGKNMPIPPLPSDNPLLSTRVELGRRLFHDKILSSTNTHSCASCHEHPAAFSQNSQLSSGIRDQVGTRNSMPLFNLAWKQEFFWDGRAPSLRQQVLDPISDPHELGSSLEQVIAKLQSSDLYLDQFERAFDSPEITEERISLALEAFLLTLTSYDSKFDQATRGLGQLTAQEQRGFELFMTEREPRQGAYGADCFHCHGGALFTDNLYHNNGVIDLEDLGRYHATKRNQDKGKFQTPSLRNIALTAPYMHDGRFETLEQVVAHYTGGLSSHPELSPLDANLAKHGAHGIALSDEDQAALVAFLRTLTDPKYLE